jgi:hypothetical protein
LRPQKQGEEGVSTSHGFSPSTDDHVGVMLVSNRELAQRLNALERKLEGHDDAIRNLFETDTNRITGNSTLFLSSFPAFRPTAKLGVLRACLILRWRVRPPS